ncbi:N-acetyltransferase [Filobacillus milosensis]|uniref:N-acetyltransferase n=1 Tax=Filobacillus milosensis TaxID=94137 RepID=A0A4Y8IQC1_9BACI|nr:GNAT family N-acetyltransferase [Filobacillus milosensis]TFB22893.1 N-acetyltransferase [Filobacillus milosensis]
MIELLYKKGKLLVRKTENKDQQWLAKWLSDPDVLQYYEGRDNPFDLEKVKEEFYDSEGIAKGCIVEYEGQPIGYIQFYEVEGKYLEKYGYDQSEKTFGIDQFIGEVDYQGQGIGTWLVSSMTEFLIQEKEANRVVMDPQTWNERALKCYEKCGYEKVKLLPKHEWHEGEYRDCWLIEFKR